jgi:hypothetical protein
MRINKTRNAGTMSEAAFWSMIRSALRKRSMYWKPINLYKNSKRRNYVGENKRQKFEYECDDCHNWFSAKEVQVDHIIECGSLKCSEDLQGFVDRLFTETGFKLLCLKCHKNKTYGND